MTRSRPSPSIALARDVLHFWAVPLCTCPRCLRVNGMGHDDREKALARALLRATRKAKP
jgi:hypothetical protein